MRLDHRNRSGSSRAGMALAILGATLMALAFASASTAGSTGTISVDQTPEPFEGACVPAAEGRASWHYTVDSTSEHFRLTVHNPTTLCTGVDAVAAIYTMPDNGSWPQHLAATENFTIREASTTVITFTKDCQPAQFDVLTGSTPDVINITGPFHGPLLFPGALSTSQQYHASGCTTTTTTVTSTAPPPTVAPTSTTEATTTTTSTTTSSTTTTIASVAGVTTTSIAPEVSAATATRSPASPEVLAATASKNNGGSLAFTGSNAAVLAGAGLLILAAGIITTSVARRRNHTRATSAPPWAA